VALCAALLVSVALLTTAYYRRSTGAHALCKQAQTSERAPCGLDEQWPADLAQMTADIAEDKAAALAAEGTAEGSVYNLILNPVSTGRHAA
jgi:hypothetical protein